MRPRVIEVHSNHLTKVYSVIVDGRTVHTSAPYSNFETMRDAQLFSKAVALDFVSGDFRTKVEYTFKTE